MPGPDDFAQFNYGLLPAPINKQHAIERAHLWWSIYIIDVQLALTLNVQGQIYVDPLEVRPLKGCSVYQCNVQALAWLRSH